LTGVFQKLGTYGAVRVICGLSYISVSILLWRFLTNEEYGVYSVALSAGQTVAFFSTLWIGLAASEDIPRRGDQRDTYAGYYLSASLRISIFAFGLSFLLSATNILAFDWKMVVLLSAFSMLFSLHENNGYILNASGHVQKYAISSLIRYILPIILILFLGNSFLFEPYSVFIIILISIFTALLWPYYSLRSSIFQSLKKRPWTELGGFVRAWRIGMALLFVNSAWTIYSFVGKSVLHWKENIHELAFFAGPVDLLGAPLALFFQVINLTWGPSLMAAYKNDQSETFSKLCAEYIGANVAVAIPGCVAMFWMGAPLLDLMTGSGRGGSFGDAVGWVAICNILAALSLSINFVLAAAQRLQLAVMVTAMCVFGMIGAVILFGETALLIARSIAAVFALTLFAQTLLVWRNVELISVSRFFLAGIVSAIFIILPLSLYGSVRVHQNVLVFFTYSIFISAITAYAFNLCGVRQQFINFCKSTIHG
jgi:O-antigen/teichoic acid export membrane protein